jgi:hypothetical protein
MHTTPSGHHTGIPSRFTARESAFSRLIAAGVTFWLSSNPSGQAALVEQFSYSNGSLTAVSGGAWQFWESGAGDASVVNGAMRFEGTTDVIRTFPAVLTAPNQTATITFTISINIADTSEGFAIDFLPSSAPFNTNTNYGNQFSLGFDYEYFTNEGDGKSSVDVAEGAGGGNSNITRIGAMLAGTTHSIRVELARGATNTNYSLFMDNSLLRTGSFLLTDPRGMNAVELEQSGASSPSTTGFAIVDSLVVVPEPAAFLMLAAGSLTLLRRRPRECRY